MGTFLVEVSFICIIVGWLAIITDAILFQLAKDKNAKSDTNESVSEKGTTTPPPETDRRE